MFKTILLLFTLSVSLFAAKKPYECLVIDNLHPISATQYTVVGHNKCVERIQHASQLLDTMPVVLKFYDAKGFRLGWGVLYVGPLDPV